MRGHEVQTKGGWVGHLIRRTIHITMVIIPWLYYQFGQEVSGFFHLTPQHLLWVLLFLVILLEVIRLRFSFQLFGQRAYEVKGVSSFAWGSVSLFLVLFFAPKIFAYPIIASCAFGDPLIGELRRFQLLSWLVALVGVVFIAGLWLLAWWWLGTPWWWAVIMGPLIVVAEWPTLKWIDDNAMMQLIPLIVIRLV